MLSALVTVIACHSGPDAEAPRSSTAQCQPMSREELDAVAHAPRIRDRPEARRKMDVTLWKAVRMAERAAEGQPWDEGFRIGRVPEGCIPARVDVLIVHTGKDDQAEQAMIDLGLHASFKRGDPYAFAVGVVSPARRADLAALPHVVSMTGSNPSPFGYEPE